MKKALLSIVLLALCISCSENKSQYMRYSGMALGTSFNIIYETQDKTTYQHDIDKVLSDMEHIFSIYDSTSMISKVNRNEIVDVSSEFAEVFTKGKLVNQLSNGVFDMTVAPLVNAWGFGTAEKMDLSSSSVDSLMRFVGMDKIDIQNNKIVKSDLRVQLDMNAIAKGYTVDRVALLLESKGVINYMVEVGGEIRASGISDKQRAWRIGIDRPYDMNITPGKDIEAILELNNKSLATSGNYRRFYVEDGVKYAHTIDPISGYPVLSNLLSVTIIADDCTTADAWATACMALGLKPSQEILSRHSELQGFLIYSDENGELKEYISSDKLIFY